MSDGHFGAGLANGTSRRACPVHAVGRQALRASLGPLIWGRLVTSFPPQPAPGSPGDKPPTDRTRTDAEPFASLIEVAVWIGAAVVIRHPDLGGLPLTPATLCFAQHPNEHRPERPILLAVDQELGRSKGQIREHSTSAGLPTAGDTIVTG